MPRARTKQELIDLGKEQYDLLLQNLKEIESEKLQDDFVFENRTPKDIVAHLVAWHKLMETWYTKGMDDEEVEIPAPGYSFKDTPKLNEDLYQEYKNVEWDDIIAEFKSTHKLMMGWIKKHSDKELFTKKLYNWSGSTSIGSYFASATSSHYQWANVLFKKFLKDKLHEN